MASDLVRVGGREEDFPPRPRGCAWSLARVLLSRLLLLTLAAAVLVGMVDLYGRSVRVAVPDGYDRAVRGHRRPDRTRVCFRSSWLWSLPLPCMLWRVVSCFACGSPRLCRLVIRSF